MRKWVGRATQIFVLAVALSVLGSAPVQGTPVVVATVTPVGPLFHYDYEITFDALDPEIAVLTINLLPGDAVLDATLVAPPLFLASYDIGLGFLDLLPVLSFPPFGTLSGFAFDSARAPAATTFDALTIFGGTLSGDTRGPVGADATAVPEPATCVLVAIGLGALRARRTIRNRTRLHG